jgi:bifunctional non-homologous end joining protein LigD
MKAGTRSGEGRLSQYRAKRRFDATPEPSGSARRGGGSRPDPLPAVIHPELATLIDAAFDDDGWLFEIKWDGFRAITTVDGHGRVTMKSRSGKDLLERFPQLRSIGEAFESRPVMVDGEIVVLDGEGRSSFQGLQNAASAHLTYIVFDALYAEGRDLRDEPLEKRKEILDRLVRSAARDVRISRHVVGKGTELFESARARALEGVVGKKRDSRYVEKRTREWVKIKAQLEQECVIAGYTDPGGARSGFGSLILGLYERGRLVYCGNVGTGFNARTLASLGAEMSALETRMSPFASPLKTRAPAHWLKPELVAQVRFTEWTKDGAMRHPAFLGLRDDKKAKDCHRERPLPTSEVA